MANTNTSNVNYTHFEIYYHMYKASFTKPADALVLFIHWCMVQNKFKCLLNSNTQTELLPAQWNACKELYDIFYQLGDIKFRLDIYLIQSLMHIQIKRLSDSYDSLLNIKISNHIQNDNDYKCDNYLDLFKNLEKFYRNVTECISNVRDARPFNLPTSLPVSSLSTTQTSSSVSALSDTNCLPVIDQTTQNSNNEIICILSPEVQSQNNNNIKVKDAEKEAYHKKLQDNLDFLYVKLDDCMETMFKNYKLPIKLTDDMKLKLNMKNNPETDVLMKSNGEKSDVKKQKQNRTGVSAIFVRPNFDLNPNKRTFKIRRV